MKVSEVDSNVLRKLKDFEEMEAIHPSSIWNQSLMDRVSITKKASASSMVSTKFALGVLFFFIINIGLFIHTLSNNSKQALQRNDELKLISKELLINPISIPI